MQNASSSRVERGTKAVARLPVSSLSRKSKLTFWAAVLAVGQALHRDRARLRQRVPAIGAAVGIVGDGGRRAGIALIDAPVGVDEQVGIDAELGREREPCRPRRAVDDEGFPPGGAV